MLTLKIKGFENVGKGFPAGLGKLDGYVRGWYICYVRLGSLCLV
jgi:hypothetical protein